MTEKKIDPKAVDFSDAPLYRKTAELREEDVEHVTEEHEVVTRFEDKDHEETRNTAHVGDYVVTGPRGEKYVLDAHKFHEMYEEKDTDHGHVYASKNVGRGVLIEEDICFTAPWGSEMHMHRGDTMFKVNENDIYGIEKDAFKQTYGRATEEGEIFVSMSESLEEQRIAAAVHGCRKHLGDIAQRKALEAGHSLDTGPHVKTSSLDDDTGPDR